MQVAAAQPRRHGAHATGTRTVREGVASKGAFATGSVGPSSCTTGVPTSEARPRALEVLAVSERAQAKGRYGDVGNSG